MLGTLIIIVAIATAICKFKRDRRESIKGIFLSMQQLEMEMPISAFTRTEQTKVKKKSSWIQQRRQRWSNTCGRGAKLREEYYSRKPRYKNKHTHKHAHTQTLHVRWRRETTFYAACQTLSGTSCWLLSILIAKWVRLETECMQTRKQG